MPFGIFEISVDAPGKVDYRRFCENCGSWFNQRIVSRATLASRPSVFLASVFYIGITSKRKPLAVF
jgi:hypothetical protein